MDRDEALQRALSVMREVLPKTEWTAEQAGSFIQGQLPVRKLDALRVLFLVAHLSLEELRAMGWTAEQVERWYVRVLTEAMSMAEEQRPLLREDDPGEGRGEEDR